MCLPLPPTPFLLPMREYDFKEENKKVEEEEEEEEEEDEEEDDDKEEEGKEDEYGLISSLLARRCA